MNWPIKKQAYREMHTSLTCCGVNAKIKYFSWWYLWAVLAPVNRNQGCQVRLQHTHTFSVIYILDKRSWLQWFLHWDRHHLFVSCCYTDCCPTAVTFIIMCLSTLSPSSPTHDLFQSASLKDALPGALKPLMCYCCSCTSVQFLFHDGNSSNTSNNIMLRKRLHSSVCSAHYSSPSWSTNQITGFPDDMAPSALLLMAPHSSCVWEGGTTASRICLKDCWTASFIRLGRCLEFHCFVVLVMWQPCVSQGLANPVFKFQFVLCLFL